MNEIQRDKDLRFWKLSAPGICIEPLGENDFALYHPAFADSMLLNAVDQCLLGALKDCSSGEYEDQLARIASIELDIDLDSQLMHYVSESLSQMELVGLLIRDDPV